jgi:hypothetical protein
VGHLLNEIGNEVLKVSKNPTQAVLAIIEREQDNKYRPVFQEKNLPYCL